MEHLTDIVRRFNTLVRNGRSLRNIFEALDSEVKELDEEIEKVELGEFEGTDGIVGESIDIIACALDAIFEHSPDITNEELSVLMQTKCEKWQRLYS